MTAATDVARTLRRALFTGRRGWAVLVLVLVTPFIIGPGWWILLVAALLAIYILGRAGAPDPTATFVPPAPSAPVHPGPVPLPGRSSPAPTAPEPTLEGAYAEIGLDQLPPFEGLGAVASYQGPARLRLTGSNPIEHAFDGETYTMSSARPMSWVTGTDRRGQPVLKDLDRYPVPVAQITAVSWCEADPRFEGSGGQGALIVDHDVVEGSSRLRGTSRPAYFDASSAADFRQLRDAVSARTGLPVTALPTCLDRQAKQLLHRAQRPRQ